MNYINLVLIIIGLSILISVIKLKTQPKTKTIVHPGYWSYWSNYWGPNYWNPYRYYRGYHGAPHRRRHGGRGGHHRR